MSSPELKSLLRRHLLKTVLQYLLRALSLFLLLLRLYRKILHTSQVRDQRCLSGLSLCMYHQSLGGACHFCDDMRGNTERSSRSC